MTAMRYIPGVVSLELNANRCTGCGECTRVCPHGVFEIAEGRVRIRDRDACMECGACSTNCSAGAISLSPGTGCAGAIIRSWITGGEPTCG